MKQWLITAEAPICGTETHYIAYSEEDPLEHSEVEDGIIQDLWDNYSYLLHIESEDYDSEEEEQEAYDQAWEDWKCDCEINVEEATQEDLEDVAPGGNIDDIEIVYDERK